MFTQKNTKTQAKKRKSKRANLIMIVMSAVLLLAVLSLIIMNIHTQQVNKQTDLRDELYTYLKKLCADFENAEEVATAAEDYATTRELIVELRKYNQAALSDAIIAKLDTCFAAYDNTLRTGGTIGLVHDNVLIALEDACKMLEERYATPAPEQTVVCIGDVSTSTVSPDGLYSDLADVH